MSDLETFNRSKQFILLCVSMILHGHQASAEKPNIVVFMADDLGFGDLQSYGNALSRTPNIDALERDGLKFTQFYSAAPICSPARAGLLTGRYPVRVGMWTPDKSQGVFNPTNTNGLPHDEITIPEMLAKQDYKSALIGKWHLGIGRDREFLPLNHGFDDYFGLATSHTDCPCCKCFFPNDDCNNAQECYDQYAPCQLLHGNEIIEQPVDLIRLARRQARAARSLIQKYSCAGNSFFLLYSFFHPRIPHFAGKMFRNSTTGGVYTDSLAEMDWQVGQVMDELETCGMINNTLVIFTSDNGPELEQLEEGGFSGTLKCGKYLTFEGGFRVPTIAYWRGQIQSGISTEFLSHLDLWPTLRRLSGSSAEDFNVTLDGFDFLDVLRNNGKSKRASMLYYTNKPSPLEGPYAIRNQKYKAHFMTQYCANSCNSESNETQHHIPPLLYDLLVDPEELNNLGNLTEYLSVVEEMTQLREIESGKIEFGSSILMGMDENVQMCCNAGCEPYPSCCTCPSNYTKDLFPLRKHCKLQSLPNQEWTHSRRNTC